MIFLLHFCTRLIETFPRVVLGGEETIAVSHAQKLFALMYYVGPDFVTDHLLHPHVNYLNLTFIVLLLKFLAV